MKTARTRTAAPAQAATKLVTRRAVVPPTAASLSPRLIDMAREADLLLPSFGIFPLHLAVSELVPEDDAVWAALEHPLSFAAPASKVADGWLRTQDELHTLQRHRDTLRDALAAPDIEPLTRLLPALYSGVTGRAAVTHPSGRNRTEPFMGVSVAFLSPEEGITSFERMRVWLRENADLPAVIRASVALATVTNVHAFGDGNGRVARILANHVLLANTAPGAYVPLHEYALGSRRSLTFRIREAELRNDWSGLVGFVSTVVAHWATRSTT
jgi:hypothetical protein